MLIGLQMAGKEDYILLYPALARKRISGYDLEKKKGQDPVNSSVCLKGENLDSGRLKNFSWKGRVDLRMVESKNFFG